MTHPASSTLVLGQMNRLRGFASRHPDLVALAAFVVLTLVMTYPQPLRMWDGTKDYGDPLLTTWVMWWEVDSVLNGNLAGFFDANIFFPHYRTLAYSEFLIPQAFAAAPLILLSGNPLFAYNVVLMLSFVATAFSMYVLGRHLTGRRFAGFVAGLSLAFSPYMFDHLSHIQVIGAAGIPLAFLFLHRYFDGGQRRDLLLFSAAYIGQALANAYYAIYLTYAAGAYILYRAVRDRSLAKPAFWKDMAIHGGLSVVFLAPFYGQYLFLRSELGFVRNMQYDGGWFSFLATPWYNVMYGELTQPFQAPEGNLFPGLTIFALALVGIAVSRNPVETGPKPERPPPAAARWAYRMAGAVIVVEWLVVLAMSITGGIDTTIVGIGFRANDFTNPLVGLALAIAVRAIVRRRYPRVGRGANWLAEPQRFYASMLFASVLLSLGTNGLYRLLYASAPGFDSMRAVARVHIITIFCLAVLAAYGTRWITDRFPGHRWRLAFLVLPGLICLESFSIMPMVDVAWGDDLPEVYQWLREQDGDFAVIEYPIDLDLEFLRVFYSTAHGKKLVNGTSGYQAPVYQEMRRRMWPFPSEATIRDIRDLGVRWVIVHPGAYAEYWQERRLKLEGFTDQLELVAEFDDARVYEVRGGDWLTREDVHLLRAETEARWESLPNDGWSAEANRNRDQAPFAIDGDVTTRWRSRRQVPGEFFFVDLGEVTEFGSLVMLLDVHPHDYPRGCRVDVSTDGRDWQTVAESREAHPSILEYLDPMNLRFEITFPTTRARYIRILQTGRDPVYLWSIHELEVRRLRPAGQ